MAIFSLSATSHRAAREKRAGLRLAHGTIPPPPPATPHVFPRFAAGCGARSIIGCRYSSADGGRPVDRFSGRYLGYPARIPLSTPLPLPSPRRPLPRRRVIAPALQRGPCRDRHTCNWLSKTVCIGIIRFPFDFASPGADTTPRSAKAPRRGKWSARCRGPSRGTVAPLHPSAVRQAGCRKFVIHARVALHRIRLGSGQIRLGRNE